MLVLTRKIGQQVLIGNGLIQIKVLRIENDVISIGFDAPSDIDIDREEVHLRKAAQRNRLIRNGALA
ncbi:MAG: carbon storage regulator [Legionellaceae bacterium]|nr:carbon storage regulator [Legionellaceae bacterium]